MGPLSQLSTEPLLYCRAQITSLVNDIIFSTASDIRDMKVRGAGRIARAGALALAAYAEAYTARDLEQFRSDIRKASDTLLDSRPTAVSLWNGVHATVIGPHAYSNMRAPNVISIRD